MEWPYLYKSSESLLEKAAEYSNTDCVYIYDAAWKTNPSFKELLNYQSVIFVNEKNIDLLDSLEIRENQELIVYIINSREDTLNVIFEKMPNLSDYKEFGEYGYAKSYYLYANEAE